jgi:Sulfatase
MKAITLASAVVISAAAFSFSSVGFAQQVNGVLGSPTATTTIDGKPASATQSAVWRGHQVESLGIDARWAPRIVPPKGAPNVLLIMTDDDGFSSPATFGGVITTPALDRIANAGLRYTNFHSTSLCSSTRAALITGRNHHVALGVSPFAILETVDAPSSWVCAGSATI